MKKNTIIYLLTFVSVLFFIFGIYQKRRADKAEKTAKELITLLEVQKRIAEKNVEEAMKQKKIAEEQKRITEKAKNSLQGVKK